MIRKASEKKKEERAWQMYLTQYSNMTKETFIPFEEFYKPQKRNQQVVKEKSAEEILLEVKEILNSNNWR